MKPARGLLTVRKLEHEETLPSGRIIIPEAARETLASCQMEVVAVGEPEMCEDREECDRTLHVTDDGIKHWHYIGDGVHKGAWIITSPRALSETDEDGLYVCKQDAVLAVIEP